MMALIIAVAMVMAMALPVMAVTQTVAKSPADADGATGTIRFTSNIMTMSGEFRSMMTETCLNF